MKKITLVSVSIFIFICINNTAQNPALGTKEIINHANNQIKDKEIKDYKKASDSLLTIAEQNNLNSQKELEKVKTLNEISEIQSKEIKIVRNEIKENIKATINLYNKKLKQPGNTNKDLIIAGQKVTIDSTFVKGNLFRKGKWTYQITFPDGSIKKID